MDFKEVIKKYKQFKIPSLSIISEKAKQYSKTSLLIVVIFAVFLVLALQYVPHWQVAQFGIMNPKYLAEMENNYRATLAQIFGGVAVGIGIYFAWGNLTTTREGQITERFTRAVDQLGNENMEIRLGGIYALERISKESEKDYWPIMEILTAYVRKNSSVEVIENVETQTMASSDIQAVLTVIGRRKYSFQSGEPSYLDLHGTYLEGVNLNGVNLERANFTGVNLNRANLERANFKYAKLDGANLEGASLSYANLENANLIKTNLIFAQLYGANLKLANLSSAYLIYANLRKTNLEWAFLKCAYFSKAILEGACLEKAYLVETIGLSVDQLSRVKTLYNTELDEELEIPLRERYPALFEKPDE
ncbi:Pentapeptide repeat family protein [Methanosarcina barkeri str. Wiesmoor]|uniref:Pentapeptide repeat family protein n=2 Tax=Methanosarcina barkeri TaxID=2208 RepID=A0A0E3QMF0_METBA|nr:pentapeptide repeat-containing protein [Methanosarcina barkeri]AKB50898.1 Pentapeptide repeat family protein [Methanosarcina barkeri str. Wiesmoor]